jgi:site-specific DNA recombinase
MKRAVTYLRVSTKEQARRDGNPEGYSLPTQRDTARAKAESLGAVIVDEYLDKDTGTRTDKRPAMKALLKRVSEQRDVDLVIIFKLDRWARNAREDLANDYILEEAGAELVSCSEPIDRSNSGRFQHVMLAGVNEYHSRNMGDEIKRKMLQKIKEGGTHGRARLGYKNVGEGGRRWVEVDPERGSIITWLFEAYSTGEWSLPELLEEATDRGLRSAAGPNTPSKPLSQSQLNRTLRSPYYKGIVVYNGVEYDGKHEPLIDAETWQRVQDMLSSKRQGEKQREHHHYLKGTIFCGHCGSRLCVTFSRGKNGKRYPYYFCVGRHQKRTTCMLKYRPLAEVERQIEEHYLKVQLTAEGIDRTGRAIVEELSAQSDLLADDREQQRLRIRQLEDERLKLLHAHYAEAIPLELLKSEQLRISNEISVAEARLQGTGAELQRVEDTVRRAVAYARDCHRSYLAADEHGRRLMNQAFFERVWVTEDGVVGWEYQQPFATLMAAHGQPVLSMPTTVKDNAPTTSNSSSTVVSLVTYQRKRPSRSTGALSLACSKAEHLAESVGFEPTVTRRPQRLSRPPHSSALATLRRRHYRWPRAPGETDAATCDQRRTAKKALRSAALSSARTSSVSANSWLRRGSLPMP